MSDNYLTFEDGMVKLGDELIPGIFVGMDVSAGVRFDRAMKDHMSGRAKTPMGWEEADVKLTFDLLSDEKSTCYGKLAEIDKRFKGADKGKAYPKIYQIYNSHLAARKIGKVVFSGLESRETDQEDVIQAVLSFSEHLPVVVNREKQANAKKKGAPKVAATATAAPAIVQDNVSPVLAGFSAGLNGGVK